MSDLELKLLQLFVVLIGFFFVLVWFIFQKVKNQKAVLGKVYTEVITEEGNSFMKLAPVDENGLVVLTINKIERRYAISKDSTYMAAYPAGKWSFVQANVRKVLIDINSFEPLSNRSHELVLNPIRLANLVNQAFSSVGVEQSEKEMGGHPKSKGGSNTTMYIILGIVAIAVIGLAVFMFTKWGVISAALGIE